jgi:hypothetical protein
MSLSLDYTNAISQGLTDITIIIQKPGTSSARVSHGPLSTINHHAALYNVWMKVERFNLLRILI